MHVAERARRPSGALLRQPGERVAALGAEDEAGEGVHRHGDEQQEDPGRVGDPPPDRLPPDQRQEVEVAGDQVERVLAVVYGAVGLHQVHEPGEVGTDDDPDVERDPERRPGDRGQHAGAQRLLGPGVQRVPAGVQQQRGRLAHHEQRRRDHEEQQVLHHVVPEQHVVIAADAALGRDHHDGQAAEEQRGAVQRPRTSRMTPPHPQHAPQVQARRYHRECRDDRRELPPRHDLGQAERRQHLVSHAAETTLAPRAVCLRP